MAVSTSSPNSPVVSAATSATSTSTISKMIAVKKNLKAGGKSFEEIFSALAADVTPPAGLSPLGVNATPMDTQTLLDEWLANDLQQTGLLAEATDIPSLFSSPSLDGSPEPSYLGESPISQALLADFELAGQAFFGSPLLGDLSPSLSPRSSLAGSPRLGYCHGSPDLGGLSLLGDISTPPASKIKAETPTAALVAQLAAAGAFNIPWGTEPASQQLPLHPITPDQEAAAAAAAAAAAELRLNHAMGGGIAMPKVQASKRKTVDLDDVDQSDEAAVKRAKNTDAARRSRMKKLLKMEGLERRVSELEGDNNKLILKVAVLESEKASAEAREVEYERRIKRLEEQLSEAHSRLIEGRLPKD